MPTPKKQKKLPPRGSQGRFVKVRQRTVGKNAAEEWAESLPDLAIWERRRALDARTYEPVVPAPRVESMALTVPRVTKLGPSRHREANPLREAARNASLLALGVLGVGYAISKISHKGRQ